MKLTEQQITDALRGTKYEDATNGEWKTPFQIGLGRNEMGCVAVCADLGDAMVIEDAKLNAAKVILLTGLVKELVGACQDGTAILKTPQAKQSAIERLSDALHQAKLIMGEE